MLSLLAFAIEALGYNGLTKQLSTLVESIDFNRVVMDFMLSFLLFAGALHVNINDLAEKKWSIGLMATVGVLVTTVIIGISSYFVFNAVGIEIPLIYCFVFGALISPTDPIAVLGILKKAGAPKSLETKVVGESLFNDGIAVVLFLVLANIALDPDSFTVSGTALLFVEEVVGGGLYGFVLGSLGYFLIKKVDDYHVEILLTLAMVIGGYSLAQALHVSGPLAIVTAGLMIGNKGRMLAMSDQTREHLDTFWELVDEILNTVLFVLVGIEVLVLTFTGKVMLAGIIIIPVTLLARLASTGLFTGLLRNKVAFTENAVWVLVWGGLKGAVSVALALSLPPGEIRDVLVAVTYVVVVFSIIAQGLTVGQLIERVIPKAKELP